MATISDIAKAAGVSIATVSRVLSKPDVVKSATRQRVMEVVDKMGYQPNALAQQLRMQETKNILVNPIISIHVSNILPNIVNSKF